MAPLLWAVAVDPMVLYHNEELSIISSRLTIDAYIAVWLIFELRCENMPDRNDP